MAKFFYNIFLWLYKIIALLISPFNEKAKLWLDGRKNIFVKLKAAFNHDQSKIIWFHCASLGEFEQGRPLIENLKKQYPSYKILLTFFSPSGYEIQKNFSGADFIFYLPFDSRRNAADFLNIAKPSLIIFVKYEFWFHYLNEIKKQNIPLLLVSSIFRKSQPFFHWYGSLYKQMLSCFTWFFVQNNESEILLVSLGFKNVSISGDTRFDRVSAIADHFSAIKIIEDFCGNDQVIVAGSTWLADDEELDHYANTHPSIKFIIAPHDVQKDRIEECKKLYKNAILFSELNNEITISAIEKSNLKKGLAEQTNPQSKIPNLHSKNTLIIDNIGMLSRLYNYATICYVGGAFGGDGVHNVLEAAVYGKPVVFGPTYEKFMEAVELIDAGGAFTVEDALELEATFNDLLQDEILYKKTAANALNYVKSKTGATANVMQYIQEKRLLTN